MLLCGVQLSIFVTQLREWLHILHLFKAVSEVLVNVGVHRRFSVAGDAVLWKTCPFRDETE